MSTSLIQRSFAGGELAPSLYARGDLATYQAGLRTCRNAFVLRHGGVANRAGLRFVAEVKDSNVQTHLLRFVLNTEQTYVIEAGAAYFRFYLNGEQLLSGGVPYEIATPYAAADLATLQAVQSGATLTLTHRNHRPRQLTRTGHTAWTLALLTTAPTLSPPAGLAGVVGAAGSRSFGYVVTAVDANGEESIASSSATVGSAAVPTETAPIVLTWTAVAGASEYRLYGDPYVNGVYGRLGTSPTASFRDVGFEPDFSQTPPQARSLFTAATTYPGVAGYYQQRRLFAASANEPELVWASRTGFTSNFAISSPIQDDDAVTFRIAGNQVQEVRHVIGLKRLVVLTSTGGWIVTGDEHGVLTPTAINPDQHVYNGAATVVPVVVGNSIVFVQARGAIVRDLRFDVAVDGFNGRDLTVYAAHLVDGYTLSRLAYAETPHSIVWAVRSDGTLLGLTYLPEEDVWGWHRHDTGDAGVFEDACVVPEGNEDVLYVTVRRTINGTTKRYVERLASRQIEDEETDAFFVDSGKSYTGSAITSLTGLGHLEGQVVAVLGDGHVVFNGDPTHASAESFRVASGAITLPRAYTEIHVGLPITVDVELLDLDPPATTLRDRRKHVGSVALLIEGSRGIWAGPDADHLREVKPAPFTVYAGAMPTTTGRVEVSLSASWNDHGRVLIRQKDPLPLTLLAAIPNVEVGG